MTSIKCLAHQNKSLVPLITIYKVHMPLIFYLQFICAYYFRYFNEEFCPLTNQLNLQQCAIAETIEVFVFVSLIANSLSDVVNIKSNWSFRFTVILVLSVPWFDTNPHCYFSIGNIDFMVLLANKQYQPHCSL